MTKSQTNPIIDLDRLRELVLSQGFWPAALVVAVYLVLFVWSLVWVYKDSERRGKYGCLVAFLVLFCGWPYTLILWLVFRPSRGRRRR